MIAMVIRRPDRVKVLSKEGLEKSLVCPKTTQVV